jgi:putative redox protein
MMSEDWREVQAEWLGDYAFRGSNAAGGSLQMGTYEGKPGVSPMELLLLGVAGCTGVDVVSILTKKCKDLKDIKVSVRARRADEHPKIWNEIEVTYHLWGADLDEKSVEQAIQLSEEKYCSASAMLSASAKMRSTYVIHTDDES